MRHSDCLLAPLAKLERRRPFEPSARAAFLAMSCERKSFPAQSDILREGEKSRSCRFLQSGFVSRSKTVPGGGRQIVPFHIGGDLVDLPAALLMVADHTLRTHQASVLVSIDHLVILQLAQDYPEIGRAFWFDTLVESSIFREWGLNLGRRSARERTAHLIMEIGYRLDEADLGDRGNYAFPITQSDMADALGLTCVHVNRSLKWLRESGYIAMQGKRMVIDDWETLACFASFEPLYLHPEGPRALPHPQPRLSA